MEKTQMLCIQMTTLSVADKYVYLDQTVLCTTKEIHIILLRSDLSINSQRNNGNFPLIIKEDSEISLMVRVKVSGNFAKRMERVRRVSGTKARLLGIHTRLKRIPCRMINMTLFVNTAAQMKNQPPAVREILRCARRVETLLGGSAFFLL